VRELRNMMEHALLRAHDGIIALEQIHFLAASSAAPTQQAFGDITTSTRATTESPVQNDDPDRAAAAIIRYVQHHGSITNTQVRKITPLSQRRVSYLLQQLVADGRLARVGERRWSRYEIPDGEAAPR
jgi:predicted HTH transcriptional regulator